MAEITYKDIDAKKNELWEEFEKEFPKTFHLDVTWSECRLQLIKDNYLLKADVISKISSFIWKYNELMKLEQLAKQFFPPAEQAEPKS